MRFVLFQSRRYDEVIVQCRKALELDANLARGRLCLGRLYLVTGMHAEAVAELERTASVSERRKGMGLLAYAYAVSGPRERALPIIEELREQSRREHVSSLEFAFECTGAGDKDHASEWLGRGVDVRDASVVDRLLLNPVADPLRTDARFTLLLERVGLK